MNQVAIISVDGHVKASRTAYREYFETQYLDAYDEWVKAQEEAGVPDAGNLNHDFGLDSQWDSDKRVRVLEDVGVVAEVLFPNGLPFQVLASGGCRASHETRRSTARRGWPTTVGWPTSVPRCRDGAPVRRSSRSMTTSTSRSRTCTGRRSTASAGS